MVRFKKLLLYIPLIFSTLHGFSQESSKNYELEKEFRTGIHLYERSQFNAASHSFELVNKSLIEQSALGLDENASQMLIQSTYYISICDLELYHQGAENKLSSIKFKILFISC